MKVTILGLLLSAAALAAGAQTSPTQIAIDFADPSLSSSSVERTQINVETTGDSGTVAGNITISTLDDWLIGLKLKSPIKKNQKEVELANLDGLAGSPTATLTISRALWAEVPPGSLTKLCREYNASLELPERIDVEKECTFADRNSLGRKSHAWPARLTGIERAAEHEICREYNSMGIGEPLLVDPNWPDGAGPLPDGYRGRCSIDELRRIDSAWVKKWQAAVTKKLLAACKEHNLARPTTERGGWIELSGQCGLGELRKRGEPWASRASALVDSPWFFSVSATIAEQSFSFTDPESSFDENQVSETGRSYGIAIGRLISGNYMGINLRKEKSFKAAKSTELCVPLNESQALTCRTTSLEKPTEKTTEIAQAELRRYLGSRFGAVSRVSYDLDDSTLGYQLILYGVQTKQSGFNYGVDFGYRDDSDDFTARAFIGVAFSLIDAGTSF